MSDSEPIEESPGEEPPAARDARRIAEVFGELLPNTTSDERATWGESGGGPDDSDRWYRENRPPHH